MTLYLRMPRRGVGLVEVLVVLSVVSFLLALLLPAVQQVRAVAARSACAANLRQIGLATLHYESTLGTLPPAFRHRQTGTPYPNILWPLLIAPYLELDANWAMLEEDFRYTRDPFLPDPQRGVSTPLRPFSCPADPRTAQAWPITFAYSLAQPHPKVITVRVALNSYLGNGGAFSARRDGTILADGQLLMLNVTDGTSNTLLFGERPPPRDLYYGWLYVGWGASANGNGELSAVMGVSDPNPFHRGTVDAACGPGPFPYHQPDLAATPDCAMYQYWSLHTGGANFAFADGSVRFLRYPAAGILPALATRAGGEAVTVPD